DEDFGHGRRWWNERVPGRYMARVHHSGTAEAGFEPLEKRGLEEEFVFLNLRLRDGFQLLEFARRFGETFDARFGCVVAPLVEGGLLVREQGRIFLSDRGLEIADSVFAEFI